MTGLSLRLYQQLKSQRKIWHVAICFISISILSACAIAFDKDDFTYREVRHYFGMTLAPADVYYRVPPTISVRAAHRTLISDAEPYVEKKCGQTKDFHLTNFKIYPSRWANMYMTPLIMAADIVCSPKKDGNYVVFDKLSNKAAIEECEKLGFPSASEGMKSCVKELSSD